MILDLKQSISFQILPENFRIHQHSVQTFGLHQTYPVYRKNYFLSVNYYRRVMFNFPSQGDVRIEGPVVKSDVRRGQAACNPLSEIFQSTQGWVCVFGSYPPEFLFAMSETACLRKGK